MEEGMKPSKGFLIIAILGCLSAQCFGVAVVINNLDGPGEGFNDPVLGADRLSAITYAANVWGDTILEAYLGET